LQNNHTPDTWNGYLKRKHLKDIIYPQNYCCGGIVMDETDDRNRSNASLSKVILGAEHLMEFELSLVIIFLLKQKIGY